MKKIGEAGGMFDQESKEQLLDFKVTSIKPFKCDAGYAPENGLILKVDIEAKTKPGFVELNGYPLSFNEHYWKGYADNGTRMNTVATTATSNCVQDRTILLPHEIGDAEQVTGSIFLDVTTESGSVAFAPSDDVGWEWDYPSN